MINNRYKKVLDMKYINPSQEQMDYIMQQPGDKGPFVMVNPDQSVYLFS